MSGPERRSATSPKGADFMTVDSSPILPGRLGYPDMALRDDPRADPRMIAAMAPLGLAAAAGPAPVDGDSPLEELLEYCGMAEDGFEGLFGALVAEPAAGRGRHVAASR